MSITIEARGDRLRYRPVSAMTPDLLASVRSCKAELLELLLDSKADAEWDRFLSCAIPTPNGLGWYDPAESPDMPAGIPIEDWRAFERDCATWTRRRLQWRDSASLGEESKRENRIHQQAAFSFVPVPAGRLS
ncbi:MAG: hypothetical protein IID41_06905 [Planctomycetes bacterium]|nr:hypothetical protein [Planctomycetota bacterium]